METTTEERLKEIEREKRELRAQVMQEKEAKKRAKQQKILDIELYNESIKIILEKILTYIYDYNKLPKNKRYERDILKELRDIINNMEVIKNGGER